MEKEPTTTTNEQPFLRPIQVYVMAAISLALGAAIGYVSRDLAPKTAAKTPVVAVHPAMPAAPARIPTLDEMKKMGDKQAAPVLEQLKTHPADSKALAQAGSIYHATHQFKQAATFFDKAVQADPKNAALRVKLATSLYRSGDVDGALKQLNEVLKSDPKDANALFDVGLIRLQGKKDAKGAVDSWQKLIKAHPELSAERKDMVEKLIAQASAAKNDQHAMQGGKADDGPKASAN